jgi:hypothetical protein
MTSQDFSQEEKNSTTKEMPSPPVTEIGEVIELPKGWIYKSRKIGKFEMPYFASPIVQLVLVSFVCFL